MSTFFDDGQVRYNTDRFAPPPVDHAGWRRWKESMLAHGGTIVWSAAPSWLLDRADRAQLQVVGRDVEVTVDVGRPNGCHVNAAARWAELAETVVTGWALSDDGLWRAHSWTRRGDGHLVETTEPRAAYLGVVLDAAETVVFAAAENPQLLGQIDPDRFERQVVPVLAHLERRRDDGRQPMELLGWPRPGAT